MHLPGKEIGSAGNEAAWLRTEKAAVWEKGMHLPGKTAGSARMRRPVSGFKKWQVGRENPMEEEKEDLSTYTSDANAMTQMQHFGTLGPDLFAREILLMNTQVEGCSHVEGFPDLAHALEVGEKIKLVLEPYNPYDRHAILVKNQEGKKLGYLPRSKNEVLFHLMDAGKFLYGEVARVYEFQDIKNHNPRYQLVINVYMQD